MNKIFFKALAILIVGAFVFSTGFTSKSLRPVECTYIVRSGDTVWTIADKYMDKQDGTRDKRELVFNIRQANNLNSCLIYAGQKLIIPLEVADK